MMEVRLAGGGVGAVVDGWEASIKGNTRLLITFGSSSRWCSTCGLSVSCNLDRKCVLTISNLNCRKSSSVIVAA